MSRLTLAIVTGATGHPRLGACMDSVTRLEADDRLRVEHWIVIDGPEYRDRVHEIVATSVPNPNRRVIELPYNTGADGGRYLCHRVIAAASYMVPDGWWMGVLDEDNGVLPHHARAIADAMARAPDTRWGYTLRTVVRDAPDDATVRDTVESMGLIRSTCLGPGDHLVDTNCYVVKASLARELAPLWGTSPARTPGRMEADRLVITSLAAHEPAAWCTRDWTVRYTVGNRSDSVSMDFFTQAEMPPWNPAKPDLYVFHFDRDKTHRAISWAIAPSSDPDAACREWCPSMLEGLPEDWNLINGFDSVHALPHDATCLITMCHPATLPLRRLAELKATTHPTMRRLLYTAEGPNIRHQAQWTLAFLREAADVVLTFARHVLESDLKTVATPHNARFLSEATVDAACRENRGPGTGSVAMVLQPRPGLDAYAIDGVQCHCLDGRRVEAADGLGSRLSVVGQGWHDAVAAIHPDRRPTVVYDTPRFEDPKTPMDTYVEHDYALILENTDCVGYVSEKIGDALMAGAVPLYDGRSIDRSPDAPPNHQLLLQGRGVWWLDISTCGGPGTLGDQIRQLVDAISPHRLAEMKRSVKDARRAYLLATGTDAIRRAVALATA